MTETPWPGSQPQLPPELIEDIIVELSGDWRSLEACSLTARCFRQPSQKALFKTLTIILKKTHIAAISRLNDAMISNRLLGTYVQTLRLSLGREDLTTDALKRLLHLRNLEIYGGDHTTNNPLNSLPINWFEIGQELQLDLIGLIGTRTLEQLTFSDILGFPLSILRDCSRLKDLHFIGNSTPFTNPGSNSGGASSCDPLWISHLESLTCPALDVQWVIDSLGHPTSSLSLTRLKRYNSVLYPDAPNTQFEKFQKVIDLAVSTIEIISITLSIAEPHELCFDISKLANLRVIHIRTSRPIDKTLRFVDRMLETIPEQNRLEGVEFMVAGNHLLDDPIAIRAWRVIDDRLIQKRFKKVLRRVSVSVFKYTAYALAFDRSEILQGLAKLNSRGIVTIQLIDMKAQT